MPNRLANETSPYLQQHADNPVDWYPWGTEAIEYAIREHKPIFLSIGYAACHWCHVMAHESFEDQETAAYMNQYFVNVKVDREERPDLDTIYMQATVAMTRQGGWPMSVFLTPDGAPFYAGTYFPKQPRYGMPSFRQVLASIADAWTNRQTDVSRTADSLISFYKNESRFNNIGQKYLDETVPSEALRQLRMGFDQVNGGWGRAPKFPQAMTIEFLLAHYSRTGDSDALSMAEQTLTRMANGGLYDQLGGGFHRYSTDDVWLVPHFEKMLYDNSQMARVYAHAWQLTRNPLYLKVATETLDYVMTEMTHADGGFYSTQDADSEGEEGKFFVWSIDEIHKELGKFGGIFCEVFGVTKKGTFEGENILHVSSSQMSVAMRHGLSEAELSQLIEDARHKLLGVRGRRIKPGRDEKVLTAWNGTMLAAFAEAATIFDRTDYRQVAVRNADFLLRELCQPNGRLHRAWKENHGSRLNAYLEDYAMLIDGLLSLYQCDFDERWFVAARQLADVIIERYSAPDGTFYDTSDDHEALITRPHDMQDNAVPSGNSMCSLVLLKLASFTGDASYMARAHCGLSLLQSALIEHPTAFGHWLLAYEYAATDPIEIAIVGHSGDDQYQKLFAEARKQFRPNQVMAAVAPDQKTDVPLLDQRVAIDGHATAYVCRRMSCQLPVTSPKALAEQLPEVYGYRVDNTD